MKHKIDKLFSDKLQEYEIVPSNEAWKKIEQMKTPKERRITPVYWVAASILIMGIVGVWRLNDQEEIVSELAIADQLTITSSEVGESLMKSESELENETKIPTLPLSKEKIRELVVSDIKTSSTPIPPKDIGSVDIIILEKDESFQKSIIPMNEIIKEEHLIVDIEEQDGMKLRLENNRVIIAEIQTASVEVEKPIQSTKEKRVRKIFRQLKNLKNGEEVNWEEVGVNPKQLIARVDPLQVSSRH